MATLQRTTGWSCRRLCAQTGVARSSLVRWQDRLSRNEPPVRRPGPGQKQVLQREELLKKVKGLEHRRKLTLGSGELYREYRGKISRREYQWMVAGEREEAILKMPRVQWNQAGLGWTMDDTGRRGLPVDFSMKLNQSRDMCSRKALSAYVSERLIDDTNVAEIFEELILRYGAPLFVKLDNGSNLNGGPVREVLRFHGVLVLNSPPHYPRYNGLMEWGQRELKREMASVLIHMGKRPDMDLVQVAADMGLTRCNVRPRPCLNGKSSDDVFETRHEAMKAYTLQKRKEVHAEIRELAMRIMVRDRRGDRLTEQAVWRLAVETWLRRHGLITVSVGGKVLPYYDPLLVP